MADDHPPRSASVHQISDAPPQTSPTVSSPRAYITRAEDVPDSLWDIIRADYRTGLTLRKLSEMYKVDFAIIHRRKTRENWHRDIRDDIQMEVQVRLAAAAASTGSCAAQHGEQPSDEALIDAAAERGATVIQVHRGALDDHLAFLASVSRRLTRIVQALDSKQLPSVDDVAILPKGDIGQLSMVALNAANAYARVVPLHRIAYGLNERSEEKPYEERLRELHAKQQADAAARRAQRKERDAA